PRALPSFPTRRSSDLDEGRNLDERPGVGDGPDGDRVEDRDAVGAIARDRAAEGRDLTCPRASTDEAGVRDVAEEGVRKDADPGGGRAGETRAAPCGGRVGGDRPGVAYITDERVGGDDDAVRKGGAEREDGAARGRAGIGLNDAGGAVADIPGERRCRDIDAGRTGEGKGNG